MIRKNFFAGSWYPDNPLEIENLLSGWTNGIDAEPGRVGGIVPHAGWYFSGKTAAGVVKRICSGKDLIVVIGGHLPAGSRILAAYENRLSLPAGPVVNRTDLVEELKKGLEIEEDIFTDNTVELVLAMAAVYASETDYLWLRAPADFQAIKLAEKLYELTSKYNLNTAVIGSTDLTHYGPNYSFMPEGLGRHAVKWVKDVNDAGIIRHFLNMEYEQALEHASVNKSACSAGAAAAASRFAELKGRQKGDLSGYITSHDIRPDDSFVGYAGILY